LKTTYHAINVTSTEAELFVIRCGINQVIQVPNIEHIIVITDAIHTARHIFNSSSHPYQLHSIAVSQDLRVFFNMNSSNSINFWDFPSSAKWPPHLAVDKETKQLKIDSIFPCKLSWDFNKKEECNNIIYKWQMIFQALEYKGKHFLELKDDDNIPVKPTYSKGGTWLNLIGHSNTLCTQATRAITNHTPIGEYCLRFFPRESFECPCGNYPIESRHHILHECRRYNKYWNHNRDSLKNFVTFLKFNPGAFSFHEGIT